MSTSLSGTFRLVCPRMSFSLLVGLGALALIALAAAMLVFGARRATRLADIAEPEGELVASFVGGLRWPLPAGFGTTNAPPVLVGLEMYARGLRIRARWSFLYPFVPTWQVRFEEIRVAEHARRGLRVSKRGSHGVRLRLAVGGAPMIFWTSNWFGLLGLLEEHGVEVVRRPTMTKVWSND